MDPETLLQEIESAIKLNCYSRELTLKCIDLQKWLDSEGFQPEDCAKRLSSLIVTMTGRMLYNTQ